MESLTERSRASRYAIALLAPVVAAGVMQVTWPLFQHSPVLPYLLAVVFCAWYGGFGPGLLSVVTSFLLTSFFFIEPYFSFGVANQPDLIKLLLFAVIGPFISVMSGLMHRERRCARINLDSARQAQESLTLFRNLIDQSSDAIEVLDPDTLRFLDCNETAHQRLGYTREEFLSLTAFDIDPNLDQSSFAQVAEEMDKSSFVIFESVHRTKDGSTFPVEINVKNIRLERDYRLAVVRDITERKRAEAALQESEARFRQLSEAPFEPIILHENGTILEVNQSFCGLYGYERAEVIGKSVLDLTAPEFREALQQRVQLEGVAPFEGLALRKDGTIFRTEIAAKPIQYQGRVVRVAAIRDITERKRNERRQAAQYGVTRVLAESATLADATPKLLRVICENLRFKMGEFWRLRDGSLRCVETWCVPAFAATSFIEASRQIELAPGDCLPGRVWQSGQPAWVSDVMTDPRFVRAAIAGEVGLRGAVAFPILLGNQNLGVMLFFSRRDPEVDEDLLKIMSAIGSQIGQFTERKRTQKALRESEERYRDLVENSREFISTHDLDGWVLAANRAAAEALGYESSDLLEGKNIRDFLVPEIRHEFERYMARVREHGATAGVMLVQTRTGERRIWEYYNSLRTEGVATPTVRGMARDITERREAEKALRVSERKYRNIFSFAPLGICQSLPDGTIVTANKALATMLGYDSVDELLALKLDSDVYFVAGARQELIAKYEPRGRAVDLEIQLKRKDGSPFWVQIDAHAVNGPGGATEYFEAFVRDITRRKRAEESLRLFRNLIGQSSDAIEVLDPTTLRFLDCNTTAHQWLGYTREEFLSLTAFDVDPIIDQSLIAQLAEGTDKSSFAIFESVHRRKDGSTFPVEINAKNIQLERNYRLAVVRDITERKRAEEKLKATSDQLRALSARLHSAREEEGTRIARELHDELGSALTTLRWSLDEVDSLLSTVAPKENTEALREKLTTATTLVEGTLETVRRISSELRPGILDDVGLIVAIESETRQFQTSSGIVCYFDSALEKVQLTRAQSTAIFRIFQETLTNVLRHAKATRVDVTIADEEGQFVLTIKDNGRGITEEEKSGAKSLGLLGMRERAYLIGGEVDITGVEGGTVVTVRIPS